MRNLRVIFDNIYQNLDFYTTVILAVLIAILGLVGVVNQAVISSAILATLSLVSYSLIKNRHQDEEIKSKLLELNAREQLSEIFFSEDFNPYDLRESIIQSNEAVFFGLTFTQTIQALSPSFEQALRQNLKIRFLLIEGKSSASVMAAFRNKLRRTPDKVDRLVEDTLIRLAEVSNSVSGFKGNLEVRVVDYLPSWTLVAINPYETDGWMWIRLTTFRVSNDRRPGFRLSRKNDSKWFSSFLEQFEAIWQESKIVDLDQYS
ncbi:MAG: hypothetical protein Kow00121_26620 [Elainellaceae cyanobacterium]